jgi:hypothetical protein
MSFAVLMRGGMLPLGLGRQSRSRPARKGIGFEVAQVAHGLRRGARHLARQRELALLVTPVQRLRDAFALHPVPAFRQPPARLAIAPGLHERLVLRVGDQSVGKLVRRQPDAMARRLVVEREPRARMADLAAAAFEPHPAQRSNQTLLAQHKIGAIRRRQRVERQQMQEIREDQLLVLLFVLQAKLDEVERAQRQASAASQQCFQARVDLRAIAAHLVHRWTREQAPLRSRMAAADGVVVRVEEMPEARVERHKRGSCAASTKVSKNHVVCARCHLTGDASAMDCAPQSSSDNGAASASVSARTSCKRCRRKTVRSRQQCSCPFLASINDAGKGKRRANAGPRQLWARNR